VQGLHRRPSGIYVARVVVPPALRPVLGRRELIASTGSTSRQAALVIASETLARWRRCLHDLGRLVATNAPMDAAELLKIADGSPVLLAAGHVPLVAAGVASGLGVDRLLREAAGGGLGLFWRAAGVDGYLVPFKVLKVDDPALGTRIVPQPENMPDVAVTNRAVGVLALPANDVPAVANRLLSDAGLVAVVAFDAPDRPGWLFVPDAVVHVGRDQIEVLAAQVEALRTVAATNINSAALNVARSAQRVERGGGVRVGGKWAAKRFSEAAQLYCASEAGLLETVASATEREQRRKGLMLFSEFMGDPVLDEVDGDMLRAFRDGPLKTVPAKANHLPKLIKKATMPATVEALRVAGLDWPVLRPAMQTERMQWLVRLFTWLHEKDYLTVNLAASVRGEKGITRTQFKAQQREDLGDDARGPFTPAELMAIFSTPTYRNGSGAHVMRKNERWRPFEYWLPLLGLFCGLRIREACQLWLNDVLNLDGFWVLDINEDKPDKSLKTLDSRRIVPLHPVLIEAGFVQWCDALRAAGYRRVFPELTYSKGDAAYAKEGKRTMSAMLLGLGMPRDGKKVFHCLRHNANDALARVSDAAGMDEHMRRFARYQLMGHKPGDDINTKHYTSASTAEKVAMIEAMKFGIPTVAAFDVQAGLVAVHAALDNKLGERKGTEDMGPAA
jgi:integrase